MPLRDFTGSCTGGGGSTAAAPLSTLAARLAERAAAPPRAQPSRTPTHDANGLLHPSLHPPAHPPLPDGNARPHIAPWAAGPLPFLHPPPRHPMPVPEPDPAAETAVFEAAYAAVGVPSPAFRMHPSPAFAPRPTPAVGPMPWMPPPHMMPRFPPPYLPHTAHLFGFLQAGPHGPPQQQRAPPPATAPVEQAPPTVTETARDVGGPSGVERTDSDALIREVVELLGARASLIDTLNSEDRRALDSLTDAQQSWGEEFTSLDSFAPTAPANDTANPNRDADTDALARQFELLSAAPANTANTPYEFTEQNRFATLTAAEALAEGERLRAEGRLAQALLALEAAVQPVRNATPLQHTQELRAWYLLGVTHAELDDDPRAIQALARVASLAPNGSDEPALVAAAALAQAVSHVNELDTPAAAAELRRWLSLRARARGDAEPPAQAGAHADALAATVGALETAASHAPEDADAQLAVGVALHATRAHDGAAAALQRALALRTRDARLWNMLGATLANGGRTQDALRAYRRAVDLSPRHVRAWVNVGTAYANLGAHDRAARYYLRALAMARADAAGPATAVRSDDMRHVWDYLRGAIFSLDRAELLPLADACDLDAFRQHFRF